MFVLDWVISQDFNPTEIFIRVVVLANGYENAGKPMEHHDHHVEGQQQAEEVLYQVGFAQVSIFKGVLNRTNRLDDSRHLSQTNNFEIVQVWHLFQGKQAWEARQAVKDERAYHVVPNNFVQVKR